MKPKEMVRTVIAQDAATCVNRSMPRAAVETGCMDHVLSRGDIASVLECLVGRRPPSEKSTPPSR